MLIKKMIDDVLDKIKESTGDIDENSVDEAIECILDSKRVFTMGIGLSNGIARYLSANLTRMGLTSQVVGDVTTPAIHKSDCLFVISSTGSSERVLVPTRIASEKIACKIISITSNPDSELFKLSDINIIIQKYEDITYSNFNLYSIDDEWKFHLFSGSFKLASTIFVERLTMKILIEHISKNDVDKKR
jgi:D-arabinose 5-phosphate isomerase GutQ